MLFFLVGGEGVHGELLKVYFVLLFCFFFWVEEVSFFKVFVGLPLFWGWGLFWGEEVSFLRFLLFLFFSIFCFFLFGDGVEVSFLHSCVCSVRGFGFVFLGRFWAFETFV